MPLLRGFYTEILLVLLVYSLLPQSLLELCCSFVSPWKIFHPIQLQKFYRNNRRLRTNINRRNIKAPMIVDSAIIFFWCALCVWFPFCASLLAIDVQRDDLRIFLQKLNAISVHSTILHFVCIVFYVWRSSALFVYFVTNLFVCVGGNWKYW